MPAQGSKLLGLGERFLRHPRVSIEKKITYMYDKNLHCSRQQKSKN
jgi:hypothetical protein